MQSGGGETSGGQGPYLLCYDGSREAAHAIQEAGRILGGGEALVLHAWSPPSALFLEGRFIDEETSPLAPAAQEFDSAAAEDAERTVGEGVELATTAGFDATPLAQRAKGAVWHVIVRIASEREARAVIVGSQAMSRLQRAILGSSAQAIVDHSDRPVLVVPLPRDDGG